MILPFYPYEISINHQFPFSIPQVFSPSCKSYSYLTPSCTETWLDHRVRGQVPPDWSPGVLSQTLKHHETFPENHWLRLGWKRDSYFGPVQSPKVSATSMPGSLLRAYESPPFDTKTPRVSSIFGIPGDSGRTKGTAETAGAPPHEFSRKKQTIVAVFDFVPQRNPCEVCEELIYLIWVDWDDIKLTLNFPPLGILCPPGDMSVFSNTPDLVRLQLRNTKVMGRFKARAPLKSLELRHLEELTGSISTGANLGAGSSFIDYTWLVVWNMFYFSIYWE